VSELRRRADTSARVTVETRLLRRCCCLETAARRAGEAREADMVDMVGVSAEGSGDRDGIYQRDEKAQMCVQETTLSFWNPYPLFIVTDMHT
jgi:hypothetical protein